MKPVLASIIPTLYLILAATPTASVSDRHVLRYLVTPVKLYDTNGNFLKKIEADALPTPPVEIVGEGAVGQTVAIRVKNELLYLPPNEVQTDDSVCPAGTTLARIPSGSRLAGENAGAGDGNVRCTPNAGN